MEEELDPPRVPLPKTPVLITAATKWEAEPLVKALGLDAKGPTRFTGTYAGRQITLLRTGVGAKKTADALEISPADYGVVISTGLCGAMQPGIKAGDIIADGREAELDLVKPLRETALELGLPFHFGKILHTNIVLQPKAKRALGEEQRAVACDMESQAVKRWADGKTAAIAVRVVLDEIDEECPTETPDGESFGAQARFALANASKLPQLIKTGWRASSGMKTLATFLKKYLETI